jgi:hypothetical protein
LDAAEREPEPVIRSPNAKSRSRGRRELVTARASDRTDVSTATHMSTQMDELLAGYRRRIKLARMPQRIRREARRQLKRLTTFPFGSFEHYMVRGYLEAIIEMPWPERVASERRLLAAMVGSEA